MVITISPNCLFYSLPTQGWFLSFPHYLSYDFCSAPQFSIYETPILQGPTCACISMTIFMSNPSLLIPKEYHYSRLNVYTLYYMLAFHVILNFDYLREKTIF
jgi:hypothetical protein